jgi:hypothetical protein
MTYDVIPVQFLDHVHKSVRPLRLLVCATLAMLLAGCAPIPRAELTQYRAAFAEVEAASTEILVDFAEITEAAAEARAKQQATDSATSGSAATSSSGSVGAYRFTASLVDPDNKQVPDVEVRRVMLRTIARYNDALTTLAEGKSVESVQSATNAFSKALASVIEAGGAAVPGLGSITGIATTVATLAEQARLRKEFEKAVRAGSPIVEKMLTALIQERGDHLTMRLAEADDRQVNIIADINLSIREVMDLAANRAAPADDEAEELEVDLNAAHGPARLFDPVELEFGSSGSALSEADRIAITQSIARIKERAAAYRANIEQFEKLQAALNSYGLMLDTTRDALDALVAALDRPADFDVATEELFKVAFSIKRDIESLRAARGSSK